jgi:glucose-1-phosphate thymidylyltransferase
MKGVILAGGKGERLRPITHVTNKHLLPVYNKPMIYYPLEFLKKLGISDIIVVTGKEFAGAFIDLLGDGSRFGVTFTYKVQEGAFGIAHALGLVAGLANNEPVAVILGDNIFSVSDDELGKLKKKLADFEKKPDGAIVMLKEISDPERFGVAVFDSAGKLVKIEEKPAVPKSKYAVTGLYIYDPGVFEKIRKLKPSQRNELEVTDLNNFYISEGKLDYHIVKGEWTDAGTFDSLYKANVIAKSDADAEKKVK